MCNRGGAVDRGRTSPWGPEVPRWPSESATVHSHRRHGGRQAKLSGRSAGMVSEHLQKQSSFTAGGGLRIGSKVWADSD